MKIIRKWLLPALLLLATAFSLEAQKGLPAAFTGRQDVLPNAPVWHGPDLYVNPFPGGQNREYVILRDSTGLGGIWDNETRAWCIRPTPCESMTFAAPDMLCIRSKEGRFGVFCEDAMYDILDAGVIPPLGFEEARYQISRSTGKINNLMVAVGGKWGIIGADGYFLVPTRYDSPQAASDAIAERSKYIKPTGMADYDFLMQTIAKLEGTGMHSDWTYQDPVTHVLWFTLKELPWSGPYYFVPETDPKDLASALSDGVYLSPYLCVLNGLVTVAEANCGYGDIVWAEDIRPVFWMEEDIICLPLSDGLLKCAKGERIPFGKDVFYGIKSPFVDIYSGGGYYSGYIFQGGNQFISGIFVRLTQDPEYGAKYGWYKDMGPNPYLDELDFVIEEHVRNGGYWGTSEEQREWYNERSKGFRLEEWFFIDEYYADKGALRLYFQDLRLPPLYIPMTAAQAKQVIREGGIYDRGDWVFLATPYLDEDREIQYKDIYLKTPEGREFGKFVPR